MTRLAPALLLFALALPAHALDLTKHTVGVGAATTFTEATVPGELSARLPLSPRLTADLLVGFQAAPHVVFQPNLELDWVLVPEEHMNLLASVMVGVDFRSDGGLAAFNYRVGPGVELFTSEWPNLGFLLGFGLGGSLVPGVNTTEQPGIATLSPGGIAALHYYF